jgi:hypothetical protein
MNRSVCKFGLAAALVVSVAALGASPAQAQVYVSGYYAPTPVYSYSYPTSYSYSVGPAYCYTPTYTPVYYVPGYSSYSYAPAYYNYPYRSAYVGWRGGWRWHGRRWR